MPIAILITAKNAKVTDETGLHYSSDAHFWLGWWSAVSVTIFSIVFEFAFLPGIRVWHSINVEDADPLKTTNDDEDDEIGQALDDGPITFGL